MMIVGRTNTKNRSRPVAELPEQVDPPDLEHLAQPLIAPSPAVARAQHADARR